MRKQVAIFSVALLLDQTLKYFLGFGNRVTTDYFLLTVLILGYFFIIIAIYYLNKSSTFQKTSSLGYGNKWYRTIFSRGLIPGRKVLDKNFRDQSALALVFLLAGVTSNLADRAVLGYVRDYINIGSIMFNLADVMIISCVVILMAKLKYKNFTTHNS